MHPDTNFPFLTRKMLVFDEESAFNLSVFTASDKESEVEIQGMTKEGIFKFNFTTRDDSVSRETTLAIPDAPIWVSAKMKSDSTGVNDVYAIIYLKINGTKNILLCQGNLGHNYGINWPSQAQLAPIQQRGKVQSIFPSNPGMGNILSTTVIRGEHWILKQVKITFNASWNGADRLLWLEISLVDGAAIYIPIKRHHAPGESREYTWFEGATETDVDLINLSQTALIPNLILAPDTNINVQVQNFDAGDEFVRCSLVIEKYYSNQDY